MIRRILNMFTLIAATLSLGICPMWGQDLEKLWIHPKAIRLSTDVMGPFVTTGEGHILAVDKTESLLSKDGGESWEVRPLFPPDVDIEVSNERAILRTREGVLIAAFANLSEKAWGWNKEISDADPGTTLPTYAMRSLDDGKTWQNIQKLHDEWTGCVRDMIETRDGRIVFTSMKLLNNPGRHGTVSYSSEDQGKTWIPSNLIDLGGNGHHDGAIEATIEELEDGRIWMLIRTNWDFFWEAFSADGGKYWRTLRPSHIDASSAPGLLKRLESGRLALVWNRLYPEGEKTYPRIGGDRQWSEEPAINHRGELSIAFSEDEGETWSRSVVIARQPGKSLAYPYVYEMKPGELWITTMQGGVRVSIGEEDFLVD